MREVCWFSEAVTVEQKMGPWNVDEGASCLYVHVVCHQIFMLSIPPLPVFVHKIIQYYANIRVIIMQIGYFIFVINAFTTSNTK